MRNRAICRVLILCTVALFGGSHRFARADELPAIQIQIRSLENLIADLQEFQRSAGQKEFDREMELMKALSPPNWRRCSRICFPTLNQPRRRFRNQTTAGHSSR
jgi:hypothetical protein